MKMTNKEDVDGDSAYDSRIAAFLAVHLVKKILDDACFIANASAQSGPPWFYETVVKDVHQVDINNEDHKDVSFKDESDVKKENNIDLVANIVTTSTPQKDTGDDIKCTMETSIIGQEDEDLENQQDESTNSTSLFINHLFDMSEVEKIIEYEDTEILRSNDENNEFHVEDIRNILDSYINNALGMAYEQACSQEFGGTAVEDNSSTVESGYSLLCDAFPAKIESDIAFYIQDSVEVDANNCDVIHIVPSVQISEIRNDSSEECKQRNDIARFENAFLSLNRDYEQSCEEDGHLIVEDTKGMTLQEVELLTADSSDENLSHQGVEETEEKCDKAKELKAVSTVSAVSKKSLVSRCRSQGARLLACLRGWWRRKTPGQRKEHQQRVAGGARGLCPLSPDARRRAASLMDQRLLRSPSPSRSVVWKFNTVNEAVVNSSHWKDYTFEEQPQDCGEG